MTRDFNRADRVAEQIQRELAAMVRVELKDPRLGIVTLSGVDVSRDLSHAKVFFTVLNDAPEHRKQVGEILNRAAGFLRHLLGQRLRLRVTPALHFTYDESVVRGTSLSALIDSAVKSDKSSDE